MGRSTAIGLDIGSSCARAAELSVKGGAATLLRFGQVALPHGAVVEGEIVDGPAVTAAVRELWESARFSQRRVVLGVSNPRLAIRPVEIPYYGSQGELREALPLVVGDEVPMEPSEAVLDFAPLEEIRNSDGSRQLAGLLVAGLESVISAYVSCAVDAGLKPTAVDLSPFATLRACVPARGLGLSMHPEAVMEVGADLTNIVIHENGMPRFVRILPLGGGTVTRTLVEELGLTVAEAEAVKREVHLSGYGSGASGTTRIVSRVVSQLVEEIRGTLDYFAATSPHGPVTRVVLGGGGSLVAGFSAMLADRLLVPVEGASALSALNVARTGLSDAQLRFIDPVACVPIGLAIGAAA